MRAKPYIPEPDPAGRPDKALAAEAWANYRRRNDSVIVDHFQASFCICRLFCCPVKRKEESAVPTLRTACRPQNV